MADDTIFALSSAPGRAAISVVRISGTWAGAVLTNLIGRSPPARRAVLANVAFEGVTLDRALAIWFPGPNTATGEDLAELHLHGGRAVVQSVLAALGNFDGLRLALPGEFTRRAFHHGRMDLTQAEGLADLINAETEAQAAQALRQMDGALGVLYDGWRSRILRALAMTEAVIDFPDEEVPDSAAFAVAPDVQSVCDEMGVHLADRHRGEILRDGMSVVILGAPNSGKSSLLNALAKRDVAIVSDMPGTTRDVLEAHLNLGGYAVTIADTAGLRDTAEAVESEGIRRALQRAANAHVRVGLIDGQVGELPADVRSALRPGDLIVWNKVDLAPARWSGAFDHISMSAQTGQGLEQLVEWLGARAASLAGPSGEVLMTRARHREALQEAHEALLRGLRTLVQGLERAAEDFRLAARAIGRITGRVDVEDVLDIVFGEFCIGK